MIYYSLYEGIFLQGSCHLQGIWQKEAIVKDGEISCIRFCLARAPDGCLYDEVGILQPFLLCRSPTGVSSKAYLFSITSE